MSTEHVYLMQQRKDAVLRALASYRGYAMADQRLCVEEAAQDFLTDLHHVCDLLGGVDMDLDWSKIVDMAEDNYEAERGEGDDIEQDRRRLAEAEGPEVFADLGPVFDEDAVVNAVNGLTVMDVRIAEHLEMVHEIELAPGTTDLNGIHASRHGLGEDHTHVWRVL